MQALPSSKSLPPGLSVEKPARNLAALATTGPLLELTSVVLKQWSQSAAFSALEKYGITPINRALFYGPPGNGKTMASQWLAQQLGVPLFRVRCETLIGSLLGQTANTISELMRWLEDAGPCVVLLDEVEQILPQRKAMTSNCGREVAAAMTVFWQYLDRWEAETLFILATNLPDALDPALLSRIELKLEFGPPTAEQAANVLAYWQEVLHEYGSDRWGPALGKRKRWESFRELFQAVQHAVREHVASRPAT